MNKLMLILFFTVCVLFAAYILVSTNKSNKENIDRQFNGIVESVHYDEKDIPSIQVNGKEYYIDAGYNFERKIEKGDHMSKTQGSNVYTLTKNSGEVLLFKN